MTRMSNAGRRRFLRLTAAAIVGAAVLAACSSDDGASSDATTDVPDASTAPSLTDAPSDSVATTDMTANTTGETSTDSSPASTPIEPQQGGTLRAGMVGGAPTDTLDSQSALSPFDLVIAYQLYDTLFSRNADYELEPALAASAEPNEDGTVWTVTLRDGITFSDGRPITADDVAASYQRIVDPTAPRNGYFGLTNLTPEGVEVIDDQTVQFTLSSPNFFLTEQFANPTNAIIPTDFDPANPIGSGPFQVDDWVAGERLVMSRNENYWREAEPHLDGLELINFADPTAALNALKSGEIDVLDGPQRAQVEGDSSVSTISAETGGFAAITMATDVAPFDDPRVREAVRLAVDRQQLVDQVYAGEARVGNDLFAPYDAFYPADLEQRELDVAQATGLFEEAGVDSLELTTSEIIPGGVPFAQVIAQQIGAAGVDVSVEQLDPTSFVTGYGTFPMSVDIWDNRSFVAMTTTLLQPGSPFNTTHWNDEEFNALYADLLAEPDADGQAEIAGQMQEILFERGGYVIPAFATATIAFAPEVGGFSEDVSALPFMGSRFREVYFS